MMEINNKKTKISQFDTPLGIVFTSDLLFWKNVHSMYINNDNNLFSIKDVSCYLNIPSHTIRRIFKKHGLPIKNYSTTRKDVSGKTVETCKKLYGGNAPSCSKMVRDKMETTCRELYGVPNASSSDLIKNKRNDNNIEKYGFGNVFQIPSIVSKIANKNKNNNMDRISQWLSRYNCTMLDKYDGTSLKQNKNTWTGWKKYKFKCNTCNCIFEDSFCNHLRCPKCFNRNYSIPENMIGEYIKSKGYDIHRNRRNIIKPYEIDIFIPKINVGIEYNGYIYHLEKDISNSKDLEIYNLWVKPKNYHINKIRMCSKNKIKLYMLWEKKTGFNEKEMFEEIDIILYNNKINL